MYNLKKVFVYGTLRPPLPNTPANDVRYYPKIAAHVQSATPAQLLNGALYDLGTYPGVTRGADVVHGELLTVNAGALPIMDRIEGHPIFFRREKTDIHTDNGPVTAWIYWASKGLVLGRPRITNGDWLRRSEAQPDLASEDLVTQEPIDETLQNLVVRFAQAECCWFSCVQPDGRAHSTPIWHVWHQGRAYVVTLSNAIKTKSISENPNIVISHPDPINPVIIEGWATPAPAMEAKLQPLFKAKYNWDISTDSDYDAIIEITPTKLMAWGNYGDGRWPGEAVIRVKNVVLSNTNKIT